MTPEMVKTEKSAQVFMASKFVVSNNADFSDARRFAKSLGIGTYARRHHR